MKLLISFEKILEQNRYATSISLMIIIASGLFLRLYFTIWNIPSPAPDAFVFMIEATDFAKGDFNYFSTRFLWPSFLSIFFYFFNFDNIMNYFNLMRIISIFVSCATIPIVYLISKQYVSTRYALLAASFFSFAPNLIMNSILAITEPLFILLGLISFFFLIQNNNKLKLCSFLFAGLAFDTRLNGIVMIILVVIVLVFSIRPKTKMLKHIVIGLLIFSIVSIPHFYIPWNQGHVPFLLHFDRPIEIISKGDVLTSTYSYVEKNDSFSIISSILFRETLHFFKITIPYIAVFLPIGVITAIKKLNFDIKILFLVIIISFIIAIPQYTISAEQRNLIFMIPFFCIISAIGIQRLFLNIKLKNIILVIMVCSIFFASFIYVSYENKRDLELEIEKEQFGKYVVNNFSGRLMGHSYNQITHNIPDARLGNLENGNVFNDKIAILATYTPMDSPQKLDDITKTLRIDYLIVDNEPDNRYPIFQDIFLNEEKYPELKKIFDSKEHGYRKYHVKIFKINQEMGE